MLKLYDIYMYILIHTHIYIYLYILYFPYVYLSLHVPIGRAAAASWVPLRAPCWRRGAQRKQATFEPTLLDMFHMIY